MRKSTKIVGDYKVILKFYDGYGEKLGRKQDIISKFGNVFVREEYPKTDFIIKAYILE